MSHMSPKLEIFLDEGLDNLKEEGLYSTIDVVEGANGSNNRN